MERHQEWLPASPFDLDGKVAIVTGGSRGLGRSIALALAGARARVVLAGRDSSALSAVVREVEAIGGSALPVVVDVTDMPSVTSMVEQTMRAYGRVDILVNNAGVVEIKPFIDVTESDFLRIMDTNLMGTFRCTLAVGRLMIAQMSGKVINISSSAGIRGRSLEVPYSASKGAINMFSLSLASEWARYNVNINVVCPGYFETAINFEQLRDPDLRKKIEGRIPLRRIGHPEELGPTVVFLASPASNYMTGQVISVDGGTTCK